MSAAFGRAGPPRQLSFVGVGASTTIAKVNADWRVHLGRWGRRLACGLPDELYAALDVPRRAVVLRVPGLVDPGPRDGEARLRVCGGQARRCVHLPDLAAVGVGVGAYVVIETTVTTCCIRRLR